MAEMSKDTIREKVWNELEQKDLVNFPRPCKYRIPNFKGTDEAAQKLAALPIFKEAVTIKVNPDKPQDHVRFFALEQNKQLLVPTPRLRNGLFNVVVPPVCPDGEVLSVKQLHICAGSRGLRKYTKPVDLESNLKVQLVVIGAVAVSTTGICIGKGEGYADLEFAIMQSLGVVDQNTQVVVTVHDEQVIDIPESLVAPYDVPVDWIVTPTRVVQVLPRRSRPQNLLWQYLTRHKCKEVTMLAQLRAKDAALGRNVQLKEDILGLPEGEELEVKERPRPVRFRRFNYPRPTSGSSSDRAPKTDGEKSGEDVPDRRRRQGRKPKALRDHPLSHVSDQHVTNGTDSKDLAENSGAPIARRRRRPRYSNNSERENVDKKEIDDINHEKAPRTPTRQRKVHGAATTRSPAMPALYVSSLPRRGLRVSVFKATLRDHHDVHPLRVTWGGGNGRAFLIFREIAEMNAALDALSELTLMERKAHVEITHRTQKAFNLLGEKASEAPLAVA